MAWYDFPIEVLETYRPDLPVPADFDGFWAGTIAEARALATAPSFERVESGLSLVETYDVTFSGFAGDPIKAWLFFPAGADAPRPTIVEYLGYSAGRGLAHQVPTWPLAGYATLVVDTRGQGWYFGQGGATDDPHGSGSAVPGMLTRGIEDPATYYYRRVFTDAVLAIDAVRQHPLVEADRIVLTGGSQGGAICIAAAALSGEAIGAMPDVPFLCDFPRAATVADTLPYAELRTYLQAHRNRVDQVFETLSYFDCVTLASRASVPALFSVCLMDDICPPSTVYAARNAWGGPVDLEVYQFNGHEGGGPYHRRRQLDWVAALVGAVELSPVDRPITR